MRTRDRRPALLSILRSMLVTYSMLTGSLLTPPPQHEQPGWQRHVEWITILAQNLMAAANDLRPMQVRSDAHSCVTATANDDCIQARINLENMMQRQLQLRREETRAIHE